VSGMNVHGIDPETRGYRVSFEDGDRVIRGLVPETLVMDWLRRPGTPPHSDAYQFIAAHREKIMKTLKKMSDGDRSVGAPFDRLSLVEE
jgi:hypothetical protein